MSFEPDQDEFAGVCPYLGLADDADSHATYATEAHRCYRLPNPTRIATSHQDTYCLGPNHTACPVFQGEGVPRPVAAGTAAAAPEPPKKPERRTASSPFGGRSTNGQGRKGAAGSLGRSQRPLEPLGPRPRAGGISMPVATIGLFAMAIVVVIIALVIGQLVGGGGDGGNTPANQVGTNTAGTATPGTAKTPNPQTQTVTAKTPGAGTTPGTPGTPGAATTPGAAKKEYTVESGDFCGTIADKFGLSLDQFFTLNPSVDRNCANLQVGQVVKVAQ